MKITSITSPNNCGHITVETDTGEVHHTHLDELKNDDLKPYALEVIKRAIAGKQITTVSSLKAEVEGSGASAGEKK